MRKFDYATFVTRNSGYVSDETQKKVRGTTLLFAGAGIGAAVAVCATRFGFEKFILVDGDTVDAHNLNRQFYDFSDVGRPKVAALRDKILAINPAAQVEAQVVEQLAKALTIMEDGKPCPASQVAVGSFALGAMAISMIHDVLAGLPVPTAPDMVVHSFRSHQTKLVSLAPSG